MGNTQELRPGVMHTLPEPPLQLCAGELHSEKSTEFSSPRGPGGDASTEVTPWDRGQG